MFNPGSFAGSSIVNIRIDAHNTNKLWKKIN